MASLVADFKAIDAPKKWRAFHAATAKDLDVFAAQFHKLSVAVTPKAKWAAMEAARKSAVAEMKPVGKRFDKRVDAEHLLRCGSQF
jgi:hypothetical protein